jgi:hypothetical protein
MNIVEVGNLLKEHVKEWPNEEDHANKYYDDVDRMKDIVWSSCRNTGEVVVKVGDKVITEKVWVDLTYLNTFSYAIFKTNLLITPWYENIKNLVYFMFK